MKNASQLAVGEWFVGICWQEDFKATQYENRADGSRRRVIDGQAVQVVATLEGNEVSAETTAKRVLQMFAQLPAGDTLQVGSPDAIWVAGTRDMRSPRVSLTDWYMLRLERAAA